MVYTLNTTEIEEAFMNRSRVGLITCCFQIELYLYSLFIHLNFQDPFL